MPDAVAESLTSSDKKSIFSMLNYKIAIEDKKYNIFNAMDQFIISFYQSIKSNENELKRINLIDLEEYSYD